MEPRLFQHQTQKLILSPQIRQYLRLLQLPLMDLAQAVESEMSENPLLEEKDAPSENEADETALNPADHRNSEELNVGESFERLSKWDDDHGENLNYQDLGWRASGEVQKEKDFQETLITREEALSEYLLWQSRFLGLSEDEAKIAEEIVGNIDEQGYLKSSVEEIAAACKADPAAVESILEKVQGLEPPGVGARNLQEALLLQLKRKELHDSLAATIVKSHLPLLEKRDWNQLAKTLNLDLAEIKKAAETIVRLEPRPGRSFYAAEPTAVTPDAVVRLNEEQDPPLTIEILQERIPQLRISAYYRKLLQDKTLDAKTKEFLKSKLQNAMDFLKAIGQRKSTLHEITLSIVKEQTEFFEKGFSHLKPLRLKDIAQNLNIHESTVSRAISGKYIQTPQGTIPYRSFFSSRVDTTSGEAESQRSIMAKIKKIISTEDPAKPLSDQEIVKILQKEGMVIARRTVAKYRDLLKVLPSHLRRQK